MSFINVHGLDQQERTKHPPAMENDRKRNDEAFILTGKHEITQKPNTIRKMMALPRRTSSKKTRLPSQYRNHGAGFSSRRFLYHLDGFPTAISFCRGAPGWLPCYTCLAVDFVGALFLFDPHECGERDHLSVILFTYRFMISDGSFRYSGAACTNTLKKRAGTGETQFIGTADKMDSVFMALPMDTPFMAN